MPGPAEHRSRASLVPRPPSATRVLTAVLAVVAAAAAGVVGLTTSAAYRLHGPVVALRQLDLLYLDEPAPLANRLGIESGEPTLVVICRSCRPPPIDVDVVVSAESDVAAAYGLLTIDGGIGPGYAVIDGRRHVRYRTFDPRLAEHGQEILVLVEAVR